MDPLSDFYKAKYNLAVGLNPTAKIGILQFSSCIGSPFETHIFVAAACLLTS